MSSVGYLGTIKRQENIIIGSNDSVGLCSYSLCKTEEMYNQTGDSWNLVVMCLSSNVKCFFLLI